MSDNHPDELIQQYVDAVDSEPEWGVSGFVLMVGFELSSAVIGVVAVHLLRTTGLLRFIPEQLDLIHLLASLK